MWPSAPLHPSSLLKFFCNKTYVAMMGNKEKEKKGSKKICNKALVAKGQAQQGFCCRYRKKKMVRIFLHQVRYYREACATTWLLQFSWLTWGRSNNSLCLNPTTGEADDLVHGFNRTTLSTALKKGALSVVIKMPINHSFMKLRVIISQSLTNPFYHSNTWIKHFVSFSKVIMHAFLNKLHEQK